MSIVTVKFFAQVRERLGVEELQLEYRESDTVLSIKKRLSAQSSLFAEVFSGQIIAAKNQTIVDENTLVQASDELAFFPPVTGG